MGSIENYLIFISEDYKKKQCDSKNLTITQTYIFVV